MSPRFPKPAALPILADPAAIDAGGSGNRLEEEVVALFDRFRAPLLRYLSGFGLAFADGEEVIQEVFLSLFQHLNRGKSRDNLRGWLFRVAHNLALKRRYRTLRDLGSRAEVGAEELAREPGPNPEQQVVDNQTRRRLQSVVRALPEQDRRCLFLRAEGLRYREIAGILDMPLGTVSLSLGRSLARIARAAER